MAQRRMNSGYTLIEMAMAIAVLGMLTGMLMTMMTGQHEAEALKAEKKHLKLLDEAVAYHVKLRGRLPCPANPALPETDANFGREDCTLATVAGASANENLYFGIVPTRTLAIADRHLYDAWGNRTGYVVIAPLTVDAASFNAYVTSEDTGVIHITDAGSPPNQVTQALPDKVVAYALISYGKDKKGGYNRVGQMTTACTAGSLDSANCDNADTTLVDAEITDTRFSATYYHDMIRWRDLAQLQAAVSSNQVCDVTPIVSTGLTSYALTGNGDLYAWGDNTESDFGDGTTTSTTSADIIGQQWDFLSSSGVNYACGIKGGRLYCWGSRGNGKIGDGGATAGTQPIPIAVAGDYSDWSYVYGANGHVCGIRSGIAYCWGNGTEGEMGDGSTNTSNPSPVLVSGGFTDWQKVAGGSISNCAIRGSGLIYCWGTNSAGNLGDSTAANHFTPAVVSGGFTDWTQVTGASWTHCGLRATGQAYCWGANPNGQIGDNSTTSRQTPTEVNGAHTDWSQISLGAVNGCGIRGGVAYCWGNNSNGQLGNGTTTNSLIPVAVGGGFTTWTTIASGRATASYPSCGMLDNGKYYCWGGNNLGQLGDSTTTERTTPVEVTGVTSCTQ